jgi:hypothetical protein
LQKFKSGPRFTVGKLNGAPIGEITLNELDVTLVNPVDVAVKVKLVCGLLRKTIFEKVATPFTKVTV